MIAAPQMEREVLGLALVNPDIAPNIMAHLRPGDFTGPHVAIFEAMLELSTGHVAVDMLTLSDMLDKRGRLHVVGGLSKLAELVDLSGFSAHLDDYYDTLKAKALRRRVAEAAEEVAVLALDDSLTSDELVSSAEARLRGASKGSSITGAMGIRQGVDETMEYLEADRSQIPRTGTGIDCIDCHLEFHAGWQILILAPSGMGKTAFALGNIAVTAAEAGRWVLVGSQEMPGSRNGSVTERLMSTVAAVPVFRMREGVDSMDRRDAGAVRAAADTVGAWPLSVMTNVGVSQLRLGAERMQAEYGPFGVVVLDYLQKTPVRLHRKSASRTEELDYASGAMKALALDLAVVSVILSQPDKASQREGRLRGSASKGSQAIEADADAILILERKYKRTRQVADKPHALIVLDKCRHAEDGIEWGPQDIRWNGQRMRFEEQGSGRAVKWGDA